MLLVLVFLFGILLFFVIGVFLNGVGVGVFIFFVMVFVVFVVGVLSFIVFSEMFYFKMEKYFWGSIVIF